MDVLLQNLSQATNPEPTVQSNLAQYINFQIQNPEFGNLLFLILQNNNTNIPPQILSICCNLLKLWAKVQWGMMDYSKKCAFFENLKKLIMKDHPVINDLSIAFVDVSMHSLSTKNDNIENTRCYESHVFDFFNRISANPPLHQLHALTNIIYFISRRYKRSSSYFGSHEGSEPTLLFTRVCNVLIPLFQNNDLLLTNEGSEILFMSLSIFKAFFFHIFIQKVTKSMKTVYSPTSNSAVFAVSTAFSVSPPSVTAKMMMDKAIIPINFAQNVLVAFSKKNALDFRLVAHCCRFLNSFYKLTIFNKHFPVITTENKNFQSYFTTFDNILLVNFSVLNSALTVARNDTFLIPSILLVFETFRKFLPPQVELLNIILTAAQLTPVDKEEFINSPNIFYLNVYEKFNNCELNAAPQITKSIIYSMVKKNHQLLLYMLSLPQHNEHVIRSIGYCLPLIKKLKQQDFQFVLNALNHYYISLAQQSNNEPTFVAARLYFFYRFVPFLPDEQKQKLMDQVVSSFFGIFLHQVKELNNNNSENNNNNESPNNLNGYVIIILIACKLFKRLLKYDIPPFSFEGALQTLVTFHSYCFTPIVIDSIRLMVSKQKEKIIPFAEAIIEKVFISLNITFSQYIEAGGDANQIESASESISSNLNLCSMLIESSTLTNEDSSQSSCLVKPFLLQIVQVIFKNEITDCCDELVHILSAIFATDSNLIPQFTQLWFTFSLSNQWVGFIDQLIEPFFSIIGKSPHLFHQLQVTDKLEEICLTYLIDQSNLPNIRSVYQFASLISWICLIDPTFDASPEFQCVQLICSGFCDSFVSSQNQNQNQDLINSTNIVLIMSLFDVMASLTVSRKILPPQNILLTIFNAAIKQNWILTADQKRLYSLFLLTFICLSKSGNNQQEQFYNSLLLAVFDMLNEEITQRNLGSENYFDNFMRNYPDDLKFLTEFEVKYHSPQERINLKEILAQAVSMFNGDFIQSLKNQFPKVFLYLLS